MKSTAIFTVAKSSWCKSISTCGYSYQELTNESAAKILDCRELAKKILSELKDEIDEFKRHRDDCNLPRLDIIRTSNRQDSDLYIQRKFKILRQIGIECRVHDYSLVEREDHFINQINLLTNSDETTGVLIQLPLGSSNIRQDAVIESVPWIKDVDGFGPSNLSRLVGRSELGFIEPCTPKGVMYLLNSIKYNLEGKDAVVIGKSRIVGLPMMHLLLQAGATVTCCHSKTENLPEKLAKADLVIVAIGKAKYVKGEWLKKGCVIIDVGINYSQDGVVVGDVDFESSKRVAEYITPVPGGIGQLTVAMLASNVVKSFKLQQQQSRNPNQE